MKTRNVQSCVRYLIQQTQLKLLNKFLQIGLNLFAWIINFLDLFLYSIMSQIFLVAIWKNCSISFQKSITKILYQQKFSFGRLCSHSNAKFRQHLPPPYFLQERNQIDLNTSRGQKEFQLQKSNFCRFTNLRMFWKCNLTPSKYFNFY